MDSKNDMHRVFDAVSDRGRLPLPEGKHLALFRKLKEANADPCAKDYFDIGAWLLELGHQEAADKALELALDLDPDMKEARRLRRHVTIRDVSLTDAKVGFLNERFGTAIHVERSSQITSGSGASTEYVARHELRVNCEKLEIFEKRYVKNAGSFSREALVYMEVDRLPSGKRFRFPKCYGIMDEDQGLTVFTELIQVNNAGMSSRISCMARAAALGELAGKSLREPIDFQFLSRSLRKNLTTSRRLDCFRAVLPEDKLQDLIKLFVQVRERLADARSQYDVPSCLNKGDAQGANLLQCTDGKIVMIDLGGMRNDLVGADLAHLVLTYFRKDQDRLFVDRIDEIAIRAFLAGGALQEIGVTPDQVRIGLLTQLFYLIFYRMIRKSQELSERNPDLFATTALDTIMTVEKLLLAMRLWLEDMKQPQS